MNTTPKAAALTSVIVARHGERHDYNCIIAGENWVKTAERPWDPPLSQHGHEQGRQLGRKIQQLEGLCLSAPLTAIYSSPFLRCRQTAIAAASISLNRIKVRVEQGLAESLNEDWYRSWALPNSNGTWGFREKKGRLEVPIDIQTLKDPARGSVTDLLEWDKHGTQMLEGMDVDYKSKSQIPSVYTWGNFESIQDQRNRMYELMDKLSQQHIGETILLVSHGGPVTHLYEQVTDHNWRFHGEATYASFSVYQKDEKRKSWTAAIVNESKYLEDMKVSR